MEGFPFFPVGFITMSAVLAEQIRRTAETASSSGVEVLPSSPSWRFSRFPGPFKAFVIFRPSFSPLSHPFFCFFNRRGFFFFTASDLFFDFYGISYKYGGLWGSPRVFPACFMERFPRRD